MIKAILVLSLVAFAFATNLSWIDGKAQLIHGDGEIIPGSYLVIYKEGISHNLAAEHTAELEPHYAIEHQYGFADFHGFSAKLTHSQVETLRGDTMVQYIEHDQVVRANMPCSSQNQPLSGLWGLCRVGSRNSNFGTTENYSNSAGSGTTVYILDTGIRTTHNDFGGRATFGANFAGGGNTDGNGHGTHCAGTAVGTQYGVAKAASVVNVKVLTDSGSGSTAGVVAGVDWVANRPESNRVGSMSLGGGASTALDNACNNAFSAGVVMVVAAGNSNANACNYSPARASDVVCVGSTTSTNARSSFSNYGTCVDIFAPGSSILSAWYTSNTATNTISGTSMACPHVAGIAAALWGESPSSSAATIKARISSVATSGQVSNPGSGSPNLMGYSDCD